jgi:hypothetical protein
MSGASRAPRYASRKLSERMRQAGEQLALDFKKATEFDHSGARGTRREESVRNFLASQLPRGYAVATGFAFDALDEMSAQLDVLIYRIRDTPFVLTGDSILVPCESLLAAIEIKSKLTADKLVESLKVANSIRKLKPFDKRFADARSRGMPADELPRCLFTIFAFETDLVEGDDWLIREGARFSRFAQELAIPLQHVDRLVVLDRGIINCAEGRGHDSTRSRQTAIEIWFVHLINHLLREDRRRKEIDIDIYTGRDRWTALPNWPGSAALSSVGAEIQSPQRKRRTTGVATRGQSRPRRKSAPAAKKANPERRTKG